MAWQRCFNKRYPASPPQNPPQIVIIGAGGIVKDAHLPAYKLAGFKVAALVDIDQQKAKHLCDENGISIYGATISDVLHKVPSNCVFDVAVPAHVLVDLLPEIPDNSAVLIQKPFGSDLNDGLKLIQICKSKNFTAAVNFQLRFAPFVMRAREMINEGLLGDVHDIEIRVTTNTPFHLWPFLYGIPRMEIPYHSIHYIDLIRSFYGDPDGIYAKTVKDPKYPRLASMRTSLIMDYGAVCRATITVNHGHQFGGKHAESYIKWEGTKGAIKAKMGVLLDYPNGQNDLFEYCVQNEDGEYQWKTEHLEGSWHPHAFIGTMSSLMRYVDKSSDFLPTRVEDALQTMKCVEAAYISNSSGVTPLGGLLKSQI